MTMQNLPPDIFRTRPGFRPTQPGFGAGLPTTQFNPTNFPFTGSGSGSRNGSGNGNPFGPDFLRDVFGENPEFAFFGALERQRNNFSPIQQQFFPTQFQNFFDRFTGQTANALQGGTALADLPTFEDFISGPNFFQNQFRGLPPSLRPGGGTSQFAPPTQFLF